MNGPPAISVLVTTHNGMPYVCRMVEGLWAQTFQDFELVVVDDGSTDDTPRYLKGLEDSRVRYFRVEKAGFAESLNRGLREVRSPLVARLDTDDVAYPRRLETQYAYLSAHPKCIVLGCQADEIDAEDRITGRRTFPLSDAAIRWQMAFGCPFLHPGVTYRAESVLAAGGYQDGTKPAEDYGLWTEVARFGRLANLPETLMQYRVHGASITLSRTEEQIEACSRLAAAYARTISPEADADALADLYHFVATGRRPRRVDLATLAATYLRFKEDFLRQSGEPCQELTERIAHVQQCMRWTCLQYAERDWRRPHRAWSWLRLAGRFDPERGRLGQIVGRGLKKVFRRGG